MGRPPGDSVQVSVRVPQAWADRVDRLAEHLVRRGLKADKASVLRGSLGLGLEALEAQNGIVTPKAKVKPKK